MARLVFYEAYDFYKLIEVLEKMSEQGVFLLEDGNIILRIVESSRVLTLSVDFSEFADEIDVDVDNIKSSKPDTNVICAIDLKRFKMLLKVKKSADKKLTLIFHDDQLEIIKQGIAITKKQLKYDANSLVSESEFRQIKESLEKIEYDVIFDVPVSYFLDFFEESQGSDVIAICPKEKKVELVFDCFGNESTYIIEEHLNYEKFSPNVKNHTDIRYLKLLKNLFLIGNDLIKIHMKSDFPFKFVYYVVNVGKIETFIAPRVEETDFFDDDDDDYF